MWFTARRLEVEDQAIAHPGWGSPGGSCKLRHAPRALNSAVECHLHTVEVAGSNPAAPTNSFFAGVWHLRLRCEQRPLTTFRLLVVAAFCRGGGGM